MKTTALLVCVWILGAIQSHAADPVSFRVGEFEFDRPADWTWVATASPMRKAQLSVTNDDGAVGEVIFFHFGPGQGGSVEDNVQRWTAQFQNASAVSSDKKSIADRNVTFVQAEGTFLSGMPGTSPIPLDGFAMRGAILESPEGDVYVKFTGPKNVVDQASGAFESMVTTALEKKAP